MRKNSLKNKHVKITISAGFYLLASLFIYKYIQRLDFSQLSDVHVDWKYLLVAIPFSFLSRVFLPFIWIQLIKIYHDIDSRNEYWQLNYIYAKSWLGKYLPGKVAWIAGKIYFASERGINKTILSITSTVEAILQILTALLLGVVFLLISGASANFSSAYITFFIGATIIGVTTISPPVFNRLLAIAYKLIRKKKLQDTYKVTMKNILKIGTLYCIVHSLSSIPIYFLAKSIGIDIGFVDLLYLSGAFIFAGAVGTLALFAPSGIGVREGVIILFISSIMSAELALLLVIVLRIWSVLLDVLYWLVSYVIAHSSKRRADKEIITS